MMAVCHDTVVSAATRSPRLRLDQLLVERGLVESRSRAQALVLAGQVRVGDGDAARRNRKPGDLVDPETQLALVERRAFVSRGGHKLAAALDAFAIDPAGRICLDVGASTGGFTDVLLQRGAARVYALDVGYGQLADSLRHDPRVVSIEHTNARVIDAATLAEPVSIVVVDVAFISLGLVLGPISRTLDPVVGGDVVVLVKPQFEAGPGAARGGVVRDPLVHLEVLERIATRAGELGYAIRGVVASPILGPKGNREFLLHLTLGADARRLSADEIATRLRAVAGVEAES